MIDNKQKTIQVGIQFYQLKNFFLLNWIDLIIQPRSNLFIEKRYPPGIEINWLFTHAKIIRFMGGTDKSFCFNPKCTLYSTPQSPDT